jgi:translation initiation factor 3 subunit B
MLERKSIKIDGVLDFEWCPDKELGSSKENMFAYWTPEAANQPARVSLMAIPSRNVLRSKNLFNVNDVSLRVPVRVVQGRYLISSSRPTHE